VNIPAFRCDFRFIRVDTLLWIRLSHHPYSILFYHP